MYYLSLMHYPIESILVNEMDGLPISCPDGKGAVPVPILSANTTKLFCPYTSGNQLLEGMSLDTANKYPDMAITLGIWAGLIVLCLIGLKYVRHINR